MDVRSLFDYYWLCVLSWRPRRNIALLAAAIYVCVTGHVRAGEDPLSLIQEIGLRSVSAIKTIECEFVVRRWDALEYQVSVAMEGDKIRIEREDINVPPTVDGREAKAQSYVHVFDGKRHGTFDRKTDEILRHDERTVDVPFDSLFSPLTINYSWLTLSNDNRFWQLARSRRTWSDRFRAARVVGTGVFEGVKFAAVLFPPLNATQTTNVRENYLKVYFAVEKGYVPFRIEVMNEGRPVADVVVSEFFEAAVGKDRAYLPVAYTHSYDGEAPGTTLDAITRVSVARERIRINEPISALRFALPEEDASLIVDIDETVRKSADARIKWHDQVTTQSRRRVAITVCGVITIGVILGMTYWRRRRSQAD